MFKSFHHRRVGRVAPKILWKNLTGDATEAFRSRVAEGVTTQAEVISSSDADSMWNTLASIIKDAAKDTLGVAIGTSKTHTARRESWWLGEEVQSKVAAKQSRFKELLSCQEGNQEERLRAQEKYKEAKKEAIKAVAQVKEKAYEELYKKMDSKEGANDIFKIAKARERRRDLRNICFKKDKRGRTITDEEEIKKRWGTKKGRTLTYCCILTAITRGYTRRKGIKLIGHTMKLWERVIKRRLRRDTTMSENQFDIEKPYDSVPRELIWKTIIEKRTPRRYIRVIKDMYDGVKTRVRTPIGNTEFFPVEVGLHQGSAISPYLFAMILDDLSRGIQEDIPWSKIFADDIVLVLESTEDEGRKVKIVRTCQEKTTSAPVRRVKDMVVGGLRRRGRPKLRWEDRVKLDMKELLLSEDMIFNRNEWRARIRLGGYH
ncbi:ataxia telangiectasia mutated family protein [Tanacetum coccineum]